MQRNMALLGTSSYGPHETKTMETPAEVKPPPGADDTGFVPKGAIFFFALLLLFYAALWFVIYGIMILRA